MRRTIISLLGGLALALAGTAAAAGLELAPKRIEATTTGYEIEVKYPHTGIAEIDRDTDAWISQEVAAFKDGYEPAEGSSAPCSLAIAWRAARNDATLLAIAYEQTGYTGGAHGSFNHVTRNYLLPEGRRLELAEVLDGQKGLARLSELTIRDLERQLLPDGLSDAEWIARGAGTDWDNFQHFLLLPEALKILIDPYQVASWASGPQQVTIPLVELSGVLRAGFNAAAASFDCTRAASAVERAVCADAALAGRDRDVAAAYRQRLAALDEAGQRELRSQQRRWLVRRDSLCSSDQSGAAFTGCLAGLYRLRQAELGNAR
ncbi:MAG: DUF3298 domain-containing protein [Xanthomonadales bacterium]|nr:DUF3298 domain-containing protein [Xanthomonadales bacterium]